MEFFTLVEKTNKALSGESAQLASDSGVEVTCWRSNCILRITAEVVSCSVGFWSACWSDVIARMVAGTVPNAAFERLL